MENQNKVNTEQKKTPAVLTYLHDIVYVLTAVLLLCIFCFRVVVVSGSSMYDTLVDGDYLLLVGNVFYRNPKQGDIVVASKDRFGEGAPIVKRVIATEGQTVDIDFVSGVVYVDGVALQEDYTYTPTTVEEGIEFPIVIEPGHVFLLGDNRNGSRDSRSPSIGQVDKREILGKAVFLLFPGTNKGQEAAEFSRIGVVGK